jgi:hypothetical protein
MKFALYIFAVTLGIVLAAYPWIKHTSKVQFNAKLYFGLLALSAVAWGFCGIFDSKGSLLDFLPEGQLQWIKTLVGGVACGLALMLALSKKETQE